METRNIKDWYTKEFPNDELGKEINPNLTFDEVYLRPAKIYILTGVCDSIIRERIFQKTSELKNVTYQSIYERWFE